MLLVRAYQSTTARTFSIPRTVNCLRSQLRQRAWMHSQIERGLYRALPASLAIRARQGRIRAMLGLSGRTKDLDALGMRPFDVLRAAKAAIDEMVFGQTARARALPLQHRTHQAAVGPGVANLGVNNDLLAGRTRHLHVVG